jgi:ubiquinone/menaquinone biosynthesis C-methylase UbiE
VTSQLWSGASYERIAKTFAPIHDRVVEELAVAPRQAFLDLACGTGGVALRAARRGADVTGLDISADQLAKARAAAEHEGLAARFDEGDCQALPYADASFDAVASVFGLIFAPSHARTAAELGRVTRPGGRLAFAAWSEDEWVRLGKELGRPDPPGENATEWSRREHVHSHLGDAFELRFETGEWLVEDTPAALWELVSSSAPPLRSWLESLVPARRDEVEQAYLQLFAAGELRRPYVLVLGSRR